MASNKKYWKSVEELNENSSVVAGLENNEFVSEIPTDEFLGDKETLESSSTTRRDFLKYVGFFSFFIRIFKHFQIFLSFGS